ncbi:MAG: hypothetical protein Q9184_001858 [Pyrenodesmia sp. 2 TL-2023]
MAQIIYTEVTDAEGIKGTLFQDVKFWLSQKVPQRNRFIEEVKANGGDITPLEKEADVRIVDHAKKEQFPGTYSYTYIEASVRNGMLEDLEKHAVGPPVGTLRQVGSTIQPPKSSRTKFTSDDDHVLVNWVVGIEQSGGATSGNEIYKQLEAKNPRHTWQSWRDRWVKTLKDLPRSAFMSQDAPPTPPAEHSAEAKQPLRPVTPQKARPKPFSKVDAEDLLSRGKSIIAILPENADEAWSAWAKSRDNPEDHSAKEWQDLWERSMRPMYLKRRAESTTGLSETQSTAKPLTTGEEQPEQQETSALPVRMSPSKEPLTAGNVSRSPTYQPESPTNYSKAAPTDEQSMNPIVKSIGGASDSRHTPRSPLKRKRLASEEVVEVPSSSPPEKFKSPKRKRMNDVESRLNGIASTHLQARVEPTAREIPDTYAIDNPANANTADLGNYVEIEDDPSEHMDEEDYDSEKPYPVSPELGRSPTKFISDTPRNISKTQAVFEEAVPEIDFGLASPEGGFGDEEEIENNGTPRAEHKTVEDGGYEDVEVFHSLETDEEDDTDGIHSIRHPLPPDSNPDPSSVSNSNSTPQSSPPLPMSPEHSHSTTQALLNAETQQLDYSLPDPEGGWDAVLPPSSQSNPPPSSPPNLPSSSKPEPQQQAPPANRSPSPDPADQLDDFIDRHISLGYTDDAIHTALKCTNLDPDCSMEVLKAMKADKGRVPRDMRRCWTEEDDRDLESVDARRIRRLEEKHGKGALEARWTWLEDYRKDD